MLRISMLLYSFLYTILLVLYLPVYLYRIRSRDRSGVDLLQRLGRIPDWMSDRTPDPLSPTIWIHAVSVGEVNVIKPLVESLLGRDIEILISTTTNTGQDLAAGLFGERARTFYFPVDWKWTCRRYLKRIRPSLIVLTETEIWPGFLSAASSLGVPVVLVNGRLSDRTFRRYRRISFLMKPLLSGIAHFCMQSLEDKKKVLALRVDPERVHWTGNLKYDYRPTADASRQELVSRLERILKSRDDDLLWICGSTREREEEIILESFRELRAEFPRVRLLVAPRHPHRCDSLEPLLERAGLNWSRRSNLNGGDPPDDPPDVLLVDSIGDLPHLYQLADIVFIGGSLFPTGGHNIIEAAHFGKPILFGPHMENFKEIADAFVKAYAALQINGNRELTDRIRDLLRDKDAARWLGRNARKVMRDNQGALQRTLDNLDSFIGGGSRTNSSDSEEGRG